MDLCRTDANSFACLRLKDIHRASVCKESKLAPSGRADRRFSSLFDHLSVDVIVMKAKVRSKRQNERTTATNDWFCEVMKHGAVSHVGRRTVRFSTSFSTSFST